jgi:4-hydroxy-tetrahydrodipicolinate synthase
MRQLDGVISVIPTPFTREGTLDLLSLKKVVQLFAKAGVNGFTALGVTSEVSKLSDLEKRQIIETVIQETPEALPIIVGTTSEGTHTCIEASRIAVTLGAAAIMVSPPRMPKLNSDAVVRHYKSLADRIPIPIVVQDYPPISGYAMEPSLLIRIIKEVPNVIAIKLEDAPTPLKISRIRALIGDSSVAIFGGLGGMYLFEELLAGADGAMTGFAIPEILLEVVRNFQSGNLEKAKEIFYRSVAIMRFEFQEGIGMAIRKEILRRRGAIEFAGIRPPGANLDESTIRALDELLDWYKKEGSSWI